MSTYRPAPPHPGDRGFERTACSCRRNTSPRLLGLRVTTPARTFVDLGASLRVEDLVAVGDTLMRRDLADPYEIATVLTTRRHVPGVATARRALPLLDGRAESPRESRLRALVVLAGLPAPAPNGVIRDGDGQFLARGDLVYEELRIVIEYDGGDHADPARRQLHNRPGRRGAAAPGTRSPPHPSRAESRSTGGPGGWDPRGVTTATLPSGQRGRVRGSVLGFRDFRRLWLSQSIATLGDQVFPIAATVAVLDAGGGAGQVGLVLGARWLAIVLFALVGGVWADRLSRKAVMLAANTFRMVAVGTLALLPFSPPLWVLALAVFAVGAGEAFVRPAETALLPSLLPATRLAAANGLISVSYRTMAVIGPGVGAVVVAGLGSVRVGYAVNALTFAVALVLLFGIREPRREATHERESFVHELREGLAEVRRHAWVLATILAATALLMGVVAPENVLLPIIGRERFGTDSVYAWSLAAFGVGGVVGALFAMRYRPRRPGRLSWLLGLVWLTVPAALIAPVPAWALFVAYALAGAAWEPFGVYWMSALQTQIPQDRLARVSSVDWMASFALMPLGLALVGPLVTAVGATAVLAGSMVVLLVITVLVLRVPGVPEFRDPAPVGPGVEVR